MAFYTIEKRLRKDGTPRYRCTVGIKEGGVYKYRENQTFARQALAKSWGAQRVAELETKGVPATDTTVTLSSLIERFMKHPDLKPHKTKKCQLQIIQGLEIGGLEISKIATNQYIELGRWLRAQGRSPKTVTNYYSNIATVLAAARPFFGIDVDDRPLRDAREYAKTKKISGSSNKRNRRPTREEILLLESELKRREGESLKKIPYYEIFRLSILSCMRIGEICRILKSDIDESQRSILVRDRKDAKKKQGNHMFVPLLGDAWNILESRPDSDDGRLFPYKSKTISAQFAIMCKKVGVTGLRYHDLRREGASRLFEMGFSVEDVAQVTGHKNLHTLWTVYREIYPQTLHDRFNELQNRKTQHD
ncbi:tyrosine-type recombinase/integrase [Citrobacter sp. Marseille-Q6884]|uniref:tyrosine-type recombinase/integrase n=1 Tax=Citrobacter sp. Marseille-Q6884 TaxID=2956786 RepID=UPI0021B38A9D|nr:tyrosine-type recombinase/integrase [Citrobacter sp. Marseille-Q6884]